MVFDTIRPCTPSVTQVSTTAASASSQISGAIFTSSGGRLGTRCVHRMQDRAQLRLALQVAQPRRVRRGDVDHRIVGMRCDRGDQRRVVALGIGAILVDADIGAEYDRSTRPPSEAGEIGVDPRRC